VDIKTRLSDGKTLTKAELRLLLESVPAGLSKRQIERITADYNPSGNTVDIKQLEEFTFFK
jgi:hypothetical protein